MGLKSVLVNRPCNAQTKGHLKLRDSPFDPKKILTLTTNSNFHIRYINRLHHQVSKKEFLEN